MPQATPPLKNNPETEIDFLNLARKLWDGRKLTAKIMLISISMGIVVALLTPNQYTGSCTMLAQTSDSDHSLAQLSSLTGLSGMASMAGTKIDLHIPQSVYLPALTFPTIISGVPFQLELMKTPLDFANPDTTVSLYDHYTKIKHDRPLAKLIRKLRDIFKATNKRSLDKPGSTQINDLTPDQIKVQKILQKRVKLEVNTNLGVVNLSCTMPEARAAAQLTQKALELLQRYIADFTTQKAKTELEFVQRQYDEAKSDSRELTELAKQLAQAKLLLIEVTPILTVIKPVAVPTEKSAPNWRKILFITAFAGFLISAVVILNRAYLQEIKDKWRETK